MKNKNHAARSIKYALKNIKERFKKNPNPTNKPPMTKRLSSYK
jgi:hypothetical protein